MICDLCKQESNLVQICAFGENGVILHLHPWCADELRDMHPSKLEQFLKSATHRRDSTFTHKIG